MPTIVFTSSGTFIRPDGVRGGTVALWGAGGNGGYRVGNDVLGGGGGGGGAYGEEGFAVNSNNDENITVATGGGGGQSSAFNKTVNSGADANNNVGGSGGSAPSLSIAYAGGNGANSTGNGGGGGGAAGPTGAGGNGVGSSPGLGNSPGGDGGAGSQSQNVDGENGVAPGGGGGGAYYLIGSQPGFGARGEIRITITRGSLEWQTQPQTNTYRANEVLNSLEIAVKYDNNNSVDDLARYSITLQKVSGPGSLSGTLTKTPSNGVAVFDDITVSQGGQYVLRAVSNDDTGYGPTSADSNDFQVLNAAYKIVANKGDFTLNGQSVVLKRTFRIVAETGLRQLTGNAVSFDRGRGLTAQLGSFSLIGNAVQLPSTRYLSCSKRDFTVTGNSVSFFKQYPFVADRGQFNLTGPTIDLRATFRQVVSATAFQFTGRSANLIYGNEFRPDTGEFTLFGESARVFKSNTVIPVDYGGFIYIGRAAELFKSRPIYANRRQFRIFSAPINLFPGVGFKVDTGYFTVAAENVELVYSRAIIAEDFTFEINVLPISEPKIQYRILTEAGGFEILEQPIPEPTQFFAGKRIRPLRYALIVDGNVALIDFTLYAVTGNYQYQVPAASGNLPHKRLFAVQKGGFQLSTLQPSVEFKRSRVFVVNTYNANIDVPQTQLDFRRGFIGESGSYTLTVNESQTFATRYLISSTSQIQIGTLQVGLFAKRFLTADGRTITITDVGTLLELSSKFSVEIAEYFTQPVQFVNVANYRIKAERVPA